MRRFAGWILTLMLIPLAARVSAYSVPYEIWMGTYMGETKTGYMSFKIEKAEFEGTQGYRIASVLNNHLKVLGSDLTQLVTTVVYTDSKYVPLKEDFTMSSGGKSTRIVGTYKKDKIECVVSAGSGSSTQTVPIPEGANMVGDALFAIVDDTPKIGKEYALNYFNPLTLTVDNLTIKVERNEKITVEGKEYNTVVLKNITPMGDMEVWQEPGGDIIKVAAMMGITMIRQNREAAVAGISAGSAEDFAVRTSVKVNRDIPSPRKIKNLEVVLEGIDDPNMMINDSGQKAAAVEGKPGFVSFNITAREFDAKDSISCPADPLQFHNYLASTPYIDYDISSITKQAKKISGNEKNAYAVCSKIRSWIYDNLKTRTDIGITRSASDVLKSKVGVCRDYAILFAALARSAGIPSKVVSGLLYTSGGFYYHAWVECFVGQWLPFDATLPNDFVDATHVKLAEGDATSMYGMARVIGNLKADIKDFK